MNPTKEDLDRLLAFLPKFQVWGFKAVIKWHGLEQTGSEQECAWPEYHLDIDAFVDLLVLECWNDYEYMDKEMFWYNIPRAKLDELKTYLTNFYRIERFCDGHMEKVFDEGFIVDILLRLQELKDLGQLDLKE